jgi:hypothetical protein
LTVEVLEDRTVPSSLAPVRLGAGTPHHALMRAASQEQSFQASGTFAHIEAPGDQGTLTGHATPLGQFTGTFSQHGGGTLNGTATFNFASGSLTFTYNLRLDRATDQYVGTYQVTEGTGALAGATGSGSLVVDHGSSGNFALSGTLSR